MNWLFVQSWLLLAQDAPAPEPGGSFMAMLFPLAIIMLLFYFLLVRPQKRKEEDFRQMVANLKENDHVVTVGGIHGVVTNVQRDAERVTVRVDDSTGTKLRLSASAIASVVTDDKKDKKNGDGDAGSKS